MSFTRILIQSELNVSIVYFIKENGVNLTKKGVNLTIPFK